MRNKMAGGGVYMSEGPSGPERRTVPWVSRPYFLGIGKGLDGAGNGEFGYWGKKKISLATLNQPPPSNRTSSQEEQGSEVNDG